MKELRAENSKEGVDTNYKFSREWARDEEENKRIQKEYLKKLESNRAIVSFAPLNGQTQEQKKKQANNGDVSGSDPILEEAFNRARRKRWAGLFAALICILLILWILTSGANKKEEIEVDTTNTAQTMGPTP